MSPNIAFERPVRNRWKRLARPIDCARSAPGDGSSGAAQLRR
jgi:hypothetical protein